MMMRYRIGMFVSLFALCSALVAAPAQAEEPKHLPSAAIGRSPAGSIGPQSLRLAEIAVLSLRDRKVKLRFPLGGVVHPAFQNPGLVALSLYQYPTSGPLVTITVNPVVFGRK